MRKLTAGIFTVLLGAVSVNAADAAVASKGYVDQKVGVNTSAITTLTQTVADNKTAADAAIALKANAADVYSKTEADAKFEKQAEATEKLTEAQAYTDTQIETLTESLGGVGEDGESTGLTGTVAAQGVRITSLEDKVGTTSVADQIATALTTAQGYADTAEADAKAYADSLATNYDAAGAADGALTAAKAYTDELANGAVKTNTDAIAAINNTETGILSQAKTYTDDEIDKLETSLNGTGTNLTALTERVTTAEGEIDTLQAVADTVTNTETGLAATRTLAQQGVEDAAAAQAIANAAIPAPDVDCEKPTNKCVLTYNNSVYTWEVIERGDEE